MKVVLVKPGKPAEIAQIHGLREMQKAVGGYIEAIYPFDENTALVCNDEGKINHLPYNRVITYPDGQSSDIIYGTFFVCAAGEDDFESLTDKAAEYFRQMFAEPDIFPF